MSADGTWSREPAPVPDVHAEHTAIYDPVRDRMVVFGGAAGEDQDVWALSLAGSPEWIQLTPSGTPPSARVGHTAIYDPLRDRMVLFGGDREPSPNSSDLSNEVWSLSLAGSPAWTQLTPNGTPPLPRAGHTAIYDPVRDQMVVYGGRGNEVWLLSLAGTPAWTMFNPTGTPPLWGCAEHTAIYEGDRMWVFGGYTGVGYPPYYNGEVWALSLAGSGTWTRVLPPGPPYWRARHTAIFDPVRGRMVVYGGGGAYKTTWAHTLWSAGWTELTPAGTPPPFRQDHTAIYDPVRDRMVVYGGQDGSSFGDVWSLSLAGSPAWTQLAPAPPAPPAPVRSAIYDSVRDRLVVFSSSEVWARPLANPLAWSRLTPTGTPPSLYGYALIHDSARDRVVAFGSTDGVNLNDMWTLSLGDTPAWTHHSPAAMPPYGTLPRARSGYSAIHDPVRDRILMFGGSAGSNPDNALSDLWALSLGASPTWTQPGIAGEILPDGRNSHSAMYDPVRDRMIVFGGRGRNGEFFNDAWALSLSESPWTWTELIPSGTPPPSEAFHSRVIYDPIRDRMVFRSAVRTTPFGDEWLTEVWAVSLAESPTWDRLDPNGTPPSAWDPVFYDPARDRIVGFGPRHIEVWSLVFGDRPTPVLLAFAGSALRSDGVRLEWSVGDDRGVEFTLERRSGTEWAPLDRRRADPSGRLVFVDRDVRAGARLGYRLAWLDNGAVHRSSEEWITVPGAARLELLPVVPHPASSRRARVSFTLDGAEPASLRVLDVAGREVAVHDLGGHESGVHMVDLAQGARLRAGVYWLHLVQGSRSARSRIVIVE